MEDNIKTKVISGLIWKFAERFIAQIVTFVVSIILARLLSPDEYGTIALVTVFIYIGDVFVVSGFGSALIQKKDADNKDFSTVFFFNIVFSLVIYGILFGIAPFVADFYGQPVICNVLRVLGIRIPVAAINSVQQAYVSRQMMFRRFFWSTLFGTLLSGVAGIWMAYAGYGIWALVAQYLINACVDTLVLWCTVKWRPEWTFSLLRLKGLFQYGWKLLCSALLDTGYNQLRNLVIGKLYTMDELAYYNRGEQYPSLLVTNINASISSVLFPAIAQYQDDKERVKQMTRRAIRISSYIMWPMMVGLGVAARPLISIMVTDKWLPCVPYLQIMCFTYGLWPIRTANLEAMKAVGRSDLFLKLEILKKIIGIIILVVVMRYGVMAIAFSLIVFSVLSCFVNAFPNRSLLGYSYKEQLEDMIPSFLKALFMGLCIYPILFLEWGNLLTLIVQVLLGAIVYILVSFLFKDESFLYILEYVKTIGSRKNHDGQE